MQTYSLKDDPAEETTMIVGNGCEIKQQHERPGNTHWRAVAGALFQPLPKGVLKQKTNINATNKNCIK